MPEKKIQPDTALIATVFNEKGSILPFLRSISAQSVLPSSIVIVDGGSTDGTYQIMEQYLKGFDSRVDVEIIQKPGAGISEGRNTAISRTKAGIICVSDGGCIIDRRWMSRISTEVGEDAVAGGYSACWARTFFQRCLGAAVLSLQGEIKENSFMPSSRNVSFPRKAWEEAGGYPENMDFGEDMKFNFNICKLGYRIIYVRDAVVYWKMRQDPVSVFRQFFRYAKGDAVGKMYPLRHLARGASLVLLAAVIAAALLISPYVWLALLPIGLAYCFKSFRRIPRVFNKRSLWEKIGAFLFIPILLSFIDLAKMTGYLYGHCRRINTFK